MKNIWVFVVEPTECQLIEGLFNKFRIGLNDWDRTKIFHVNEQDAVIYNVVCDKESHDAIKNIIRDSRQGS